MSGIKEGLVIHSKIENPDFRLSLLIGDRIQAVAISRGLVPINNQKNDWLLLSATTVINELRVANTDQTVRSVLKEVRRELQNSTLNGDRRQAFNMISGLMRTLGKSQNTFELPPLPQRPVAKFPSTK